VCSTERCGLIIQASPRARTRSRISEAARPASSTGWGQECHCACQQQRYEQECDHSEPERCWFGGVVNGQRRGRGKDGQQDAFEDVQDINRLERARLCSAVESAAFHTAMAAAAACLEARRCRYS
jgi:hypothetical protein